MASLLVIGATGQVAQALQATLAERDAVFLSRDEMDLSDPKAVAETLSLFPRLLAIINAAAYTAVDKAETEEALVTTINGTSVGVLADYAAQNRIPLVHFSTDYVYAGDGEAARDETAPTAPPNAYGRSKLAGEQAVQQSGCDYLIFRTCWVYDAQGKNFLNTMLRLSAEREELRVVADQFGAPSYAADLADGSVAALDKAMEMDAFPSGIYHLCNGGETSWHGFAEAIFDEARTQGFELKIERVEPIATSDYPTPAARPLNSRLNTEKLQSTFGITLPHWRESLTTCLETMKEHA